VRWNHGPSDDFTESGANHEFPSASNVLDQPNTYLSEPLSPPSNEVSYTLHFDPSSFDLPGLSSLAPTWDESSILGLKHLSPTVEHPATTSSFISTPDAELPFTLSNLLPHSSASPPYLSFSHLSTTGSPTPRLRTPGFPEPAAAPHVRVEPDASPIDAPFGNTTSNLKPALTPSTTRCLFYRCRYSFDRQMELSDHIKTGHKFRCERGCLLIGFSTHRRRQGHYESDAHRQSGPPMPQYQCGGCGKEDWRRDLHRRHLKTCTRSSTTPYVCALCRSETPSKRKHEDHFAKCKGKAGRPMKLKECTITEIG